MFFSILVVAMAPKAFAGKTELTTYYPSPYGEYSNLYVSGNVGIGTTSPVAKLNVRGTTLLTGAIATVNTMGTANSAVDVRYAGGGSEYGIEFLPQVDGQCSLFFLNAAGTPVGNVSSTAAATVYTTTSDKRLKENVVDSKLGLDALKQISVKEFNFISDPDKKAMQGFLAQDLYRIYPYAVTVGGDDPKKKPWSIDYGRLTPLIVKSVQDQQKEIDDLKSELQTEIELLKKEIMGLKKK